MKISQYKKIQVDAKTAVDRLIEKPLNVKNAMRIEFSRKEK